jgi:hypothetical protein
VEGSTRQIYDAINRAIGWPPAPSPADMAPDSIAERSDTPNPDLAKRCD